MADRIDELRKEVHAVDNRLGKLETAVELDGKRRDEQHEAVMTAIGDLQRTITPGPPPSLPPGPAAPTLPPPNHEPCSEEPTSDPGAVTISPRKIGPWLKLIWPYVLALGVGGTAVHCGERAMPGSPAPIEAVEP